MKSEQLSFLLTTAALTSGKQYRKAPIDGHINRILISFPAGCAFLVEVLFNYKTEQILPYPTAGTTTGIALDDFTEQFEMNYEVRRGDQIEMNVLNHDAVNPHTISAIVHITPKEYDSFD